MEFAFVGPSYLGRSKGIESERCINWYLEQGGPHAKARMSLIPTPGQKLFTTAASIVRGMREFGGNIYAVAGNALYSITPSKVATNLGTLNSSTGAVSMSDNGTQIMIVDGTDGYIYNTSTGVFAQISDADFPSNPEHCDFLDGFFLVNRGSTGQWFKSAIYDGTSWDALEFSTAESSPDNLVRLIAHDDEVWLFGDYSTEVWYNSGAANFPYSKRPNATIDAGTVAPWSVARMDNSVFWLGQSKRGEKVIFRSQGYQKKRISTHAIEFAFDTYSTISDAIGFTYIEEGHAFYCLTFPTAGKTWVFDASISDPQMAWHERSSEDGRWLAQHYVYFNSDHYVSDYRNAKIYRMSHSSFDENGTAIKRTRTCPHIHDDREHLFLSSLEIDFKKGVGTSTGQGVNPQAMLRVSKDGGRTWGAEKWAAIGKIGDYLARAKWNRLGRARDWVFEVVVTDPVDAEIVSASIK